MKKNRSHDVATSDDGAYVVKKSKKLNIISFVMCVLASFSIWLYVMNTQTSNYTKTFTITVEAINAEKLEEETGFSVFGLYDTQASVTLSGKKSDIQKYSEKDFRAYIDVSTIKQAGYSSLNVSVEVPSSEVKVMTVEPQKITVYADRMQTKTVQATPHCNYTNNSDKTYTLSYQPGTIEISGPETFVDKIFEAQINIPYSRYEKGDSIPVVSENIKFFDGSEAHQLLSSLYITVETEGMSVKVDGVTAHE